MFGFFDSCFGGRGRLGLPACLGGQPQAGGGVQGQATRPLAMLCCDRARAQGSMPFGAPKAGSEIELYDNIVHQPLVLSSEPDLETTPPISGERAFPHCMRPF
eukprot:COSAG01_NODE_7573_length_3143_cov_2.026938_4_plen_103_part_00